MRKENGQLICFCWFVLAVIISMIFLPMAVHSLVFRIYLYFHNGHLASCAALHKYPRTFHPLYIIFQCIFRLHFIYFVLSAFQSSFSYGVVWSILSIVYFLVVLCDGFGIYLQNVRAMYGNWLYPGLKCDQYARGIFSINICV